MQKSLYLSIRQRMQESLFKTVDVDVCLSDSGYRSHSIRQRMQETLYQTADAEVFLSDSGCRRRSIRQRMHESLYQTEMPSLSDRVMQKSLYLSIRQRMQESL